MGAPSIPSPIGVSQAPRVIEYTPSPTLAKFHACNDLVRGVRGPFGSGKSVGMCWEIWSRACEQRANADKVRRSRWAVTRNTYGELTTTTIKTWLDWFPEDRFGKVVHDAPIRHLCRWTIDDGTKVECEVLFISMDRPDDVKKVLSLDLTGAWMNEAREQPKEILDGLTGRVGRFPGPTDGGCTWSGVIMDTNSPDDDHWWYVLAEVLRPEGFSFFSQPPGDSDDGENLDYLMQSPETMALPLGHPVRRAAGRIYYERLKAGKKPEWIKVYVKGQYASIFSGKAVYAEEWNDQLHTREVRPVQGKRMVIGIDFGLTPAAVITQLDMRGRLLVLDEICGRDIGIKAFLADLLVPHLIGIYGPWWNKRNQEGDPMIVCIGDPAGNQKAQTDERSCFQEVRDVGLSIRPARTNAYLPRRDAVAWFLSRLAGGQPSLMLDPCCPMLRKGFNGGYRYRRLQIVGDERYTNEADKNAYSHPHDALQYASLEHGGAQATKQVKGVRREPAYTQSYAETGMLG